MRGHGEKLTRNQQRAIVALLAHSTIPDAAKACGISEATLWRWLQIPAFGKQYREARQTVFETAVADLQQAATVAVKTLREICEDKLCNSAARVSAARTILEFGQRLREAIEIEERLRALEEAQTKWRKA